MSKRESQDRLITDLAKSIAFEREWNMITSMDTQNTEALLACLTDSFSVDATVLNQTHSHISQIISKMPVSLDIAVRFGKVGAEDKKHYHAIEKLGVFCEVSIANVFTRKNNHSCQTPETKMSRTSSLSSVATENAVDASLKDSPENTSKNAARHSLGEGCMARPSTFNIMPRVQISPSSSNTNTDILDKRARAGSIAVLPEKMSLIADCYTYMKSDDIWEASQNKVLHPQPNKYLEKKPVKRTGYANRLGGEFHRPKLTFSEVPCTKDSEIVVTVCYRFPGALSNWQKKDNSPKSVAPKDGNFGVAKLALQCNKPWSVLSKPNNRIGHIYPRCLQNPAMARNASHRGSEGVLDFGFTVHVQLEISLHKLKFSEESALLFEKWMHRYFEASEIFYSCWIKRAENALAVTTLDENMSLILELYGTHKGLSEEACLLLELASLLSIQCHNNGRQQFIDNYGDDKLSLAIISLIKTMKTAGYLAKSMNQNDFPLETLARKNYVARLIPEYINETLRSLEINSDWKVFPPSSLETNTYVERCRAIGELIMLNLVDMEVTSKMTTAFTSTFQRLLQRDITAWFDKSLQSVPNTPMIQGQSLGVSVRITDNVTTDSSSQLEAKFKLLTRAMREGEGLCSENSEFIGNLQQFGIYYRQLALEAMDRATLPLAQTILKDLEEYQQQYAQYINNLTATAKLSFKFYDTVMSFSENTRKHATLNGRLAEETLSSEEEELFKPFVRYWLFCFKQLALNRVQKSAASDNLKPIRSGMTISWTAIDVGSVATSEVVAECRKIKSADPSVLEVIQQEESDILYAILDEYIRCVFRQAYKVQRNSITLHKDYDGDDSDSTEDELAISECDSVETEICETLIVCERVTCALNNIDHVVTVMKDCKVNEVEFIEIVDQKVEQEKNKRTLKYFKWLRDKWEPIFHVFFINSNVTIGDKLIYAVKKILTTINSYAEDTRDKIVSFELFWATVCQKIWIELTKQFVNEREYQYYQRIEQFLKALSDEFIYMMSQRVNDTVEIIERNTYYIKINSKLKNWAKNNHDLVYTYLLLMTNFGDRRQEQSFVLKEGEIDISVGKVINEGLVIVAVHEIRSAFECEKQHYARISIRPEFANPKLNVIRSSVQSDHSSRAPSFEISGIDREQLVDRLRPSMLIIEIWRNNIACNSFVGELVIPLANITAKSSKAELLATAISRFSFYQPRSLEELFTIMKTRKRYSYSVNQFLCWRMGLLIRIDSDCVTRAHETALPVEEHQEAANAESSVVRKLRQWMPILEPTLLAVESGRLTTELSVMRMKNRWAPNCLLRFQLEQ